MLPAERQHRIADWVRKKGKAEVAELSALFNVSAMTIRRDLTRLSEQGLIDRTHGGAVLQRSTAFEPRYTEKSRAQADLKDRIGVAAASLVEDGETVILDAGSTTMSVARNLKGKRNLTVVTNDLHIAIELLPVPTMHVVVTGGTARRDFYNLIGLHAEALLRQTNANKLFLGADAVDIQRGISNATWEEVAVKRLMMESAQQVVLVADHTKFGGVALARVAGLDQVDGIITDEGLAPEVAVQITAEGPWVRRV